MGKKADNSKQNNNNVEIKKKKEKKNTGPEVSAQGNATTSSSSKNNGKKIITDPRFSSIHSDPRFQKVPKHQSKVTIDPRFNRMFTDKNFGSSTAPVDKRGKPKNTPNSSVNTLRHYYKIDEEEEKLKKKQVESEDEEEDEDEDEDGDDVVDEDLKKKLVDSGSSDAELISDNEDSESSGESSDDSDSATSTDTDDDDEVEFHNDEEPEKEEEKIPEIEQETHRLAVVNMDWSEVRAVDLYVVMSSFLPKGGQILSVSVYPSEFGLKRMEEEAVKGPVGLFDSDNEKSDDEDNDEIDIEKLRAYEKSRLRYYFAVVECDSIATADYIYKSCDGMEFELTSNVLDLRFIPDNMQFEHPPRDVATEAPTKYEGLNFQTQALQQSKVRLTWDEDEPHRAKTLKRKLTDYELMELEFKDLIASDDGDSEDEDEDEDDADENNGAADGLSDKKLKKLEKYRALVLAGDGSDEDGSDDDKDMEVTFNTGLEDISKRILEKRKDKKSESVWEANLRHQKEKKKARKNRSKDSSEDESSDGDLEAPEQPDDFFVEEPSVKNNKVGKSRRTEKQEQDTDKEQEASRAELELLLADDQGDDHNLKGYNLKPKKTKGKKGKEVPSEDKLPSVDYNDPRFTALFTSPLFALDPTDAQYKRSAAYARQVAQRQQKHDDDGETGEEKKPPNETPLPSNDTILKKSEQSLSNSMSLQTENPELTSLIRSVKRKAEQHHASSNDKASKKGAPMQSNGLLTKLSSKLLSGKKKSRGSKS